MKTNDRSSISLEPTSENLEYFIKARGGICISLYLPISAQAPESEKNRIRLGELLQKAKEKLLQNDMEEKAVMDLLQPLWERKEQPQSLLTRGKSLAFFLNHTNLYEVILPESTPPQISVGNRFFTKPLIPLLNANPAFLVLCLDLGGIRSYQANRWKMDPIEIPELPQSLEAFTRYDNPEKSLQHHTANKASTPGAPGGQPSGKTHGQGLPDDLEQSQKERFIRAVAKAADSHLKRHPQVLIVFGVEKNVGLFQSLHDWSDQTVLVQKQDPQEWSAEKLRESAWKLLQPTLSEKQADKLDILNAAYQKKESLNNLGEIALASATGRIELAGISMDRSVSGICDVENLKVKFIEEGDPFCAQDLLDWIAPETIRHGGKVVAVDQKNFPNGQEALATTRF